MSLQRKVDILEDVIDCVGTDDKDEFLEIIADYRYKLSLIDHINNFDTKHELDREKSGATSSLSGITF